MSDTESPAADAGWYADPAGTAGMRFWDGHRWTDQIREYEPPTAYVPFGGSRAVAEGDASVDARLARQAKTINTAAQRGRNLGVIAAIITIVSVVLVDIAAHVPGTIWLIYGGLAGAVAATILGVLAVIFSAIGLARHRYHGQVGAAVAGLILGIAFTGSFLWIRFAEITLNGLMFGFH